MTALNFKTIVIGLVSLLVVSVAHGKCYPGLDCPEDLPNANNTPSQSTTPTPATNQQTQAPESLPTPDSTPYEPEPVDKIVGWKVEANNTAEEPPALTKYGKYGGKYEKPEKYGKYPK